MFLGTKLQAFFLIFFISIDSLHAKEQKAYNFQDLGLINTPSANFLGEGSFALSLYRGHPDRKMTFTFAPYNWLEASLFYVSVKDMVYPNFNQDYKDKGLNLKIRLLNQDNLLPKVAIGFNDIGGTGFYSSEYIVAGYNIQNLDVTLGAGWGTMSGSSHLENPLTYLNSNFDKRKPFSGKGGELNFGRFLSGKSVDLFGGIKYKFNDQLTFNIEYDPTLVPGLVGYRDAKSRASFGISSLTNFGNYSINYERGNTLSLNFSITKDFSGNFRKYENNNLKPQPDRRKYLQKLLNLNEIGLKAINEDENKILIDIRENSSQDENKLFYILDNALGESLGNNKDIEVTVWKAGLKVNKLEIAPKPNKEKFQIKENLTYENKKFPIIQSNSGPALRPFLAGREDFLKFSALIENSTQIIISENLFFTSNIKLSLIDNFSDLRFPPVDTFPAQVRSDVKKYLNEFNNGPFLGRAQIDFFESINMDNHFQISAGIFEEMFSGFGFEYLWSSPSKKYAVGFESFYVRKRDYDMKIRHLKYENITSHFNLYYQNTNLIPFDLHFSYGEYLAGDEGYTIDISRRLRNGTKYGLFFTRTNVSKLDFGEGSFDKGIYFSAPLFSNDIFSQFYWRPLTKDPGQKLIRMKNIFELLRAHR